jgi:ABC-type uncharacterized transport system substrate-binding protein
LARPGGNVTGLSSQSTELGPKKLEILREVVFDLRRLAIMGDVGASNAIQEMGEVQAAAKTLGLDVATYQIRRREDIMPAFGALKGRADALYVTSSPLVSTNRIRINILAVGARLPTMYSFREHVEAGGLVSPPGARLAGRFFLRAHRYIFAIHSYPRACTGICVVLGMKL